MKKVLTLATLALLMGCSPTQETTPTDPLKHEPIPGQPEKVRLPQQSSGDGNCFEEEMIELAPETYFASLTDLVWGEVLDVEVVLDRIVNDSGQPVSLADCELGVTRRILRVTLMDANSLFDGRIGTMEFYIPSGAFEGWRSKPLYFHGGEWLPSQPARIDDGLGWSRAEEGVQVGQHLVVSLLLNDEGHLVSNRLPIYELFNDEYVAIGWDGNFVDRDRSSCIRFPAPLNQPFTIDALQTAYSSFGRNAESIEFNLSHALMASTPHCRNLEPPREEPVVESDMGNP